MRQTKGEKIFEIFNIGLLSLISLSALLPFMHIIARSLSGEGPIIRQEVGIIPLGFNIESYIFVMKNAQFLISLRNSVFITVIGTFLSLVLTVFAAYPLTKKDLPLGSFISILYIITMFFGGGMIPTYILYKEMGLYDSIWVLILPSAISPFNMILMRNFFSSLSPSMEESAKIDGASTLRILFQIVLPLSKAALATIGLFYAVSYWNAFFNAVLLTGSKAVMPLQLFLRNMIANTTASLETDWEALQHVTTEGVRAATIISAMIPILLVYPFMQRHFVKGVMIGAVKE